MYIALTSEQEKNSNLKCDYLILQILNGVFYLARYIFGDIETSANVWYH